jgi:hypothetical protein
MNEGNGRMSTTKKEYLESICDEITGFLRTGR